MTTEHNETARATVRAGADQPQESSSTPARRRRGGRRVVRVAGEAGAKLPVHVQSSSAMSSRATVSSSHTADTAAHTADIDSKATDAQITTGSADTTSVTTTEGPKQQPHRARKRKTVASDPDRKARLERLAAEIFTDSGIEDDLTDTAADTSQQASAATHTAANNVVVSDTAVHNTDTAHTDTSQTDTTHTAAIAAAIDTAHNDATDTVADTATDTSDGEDSSTSNTNGSAGDANGVDTSEASAHTDEVASSSVTVSQTSSALAPVAVRRAPTTVAFSARDHEEQQLVPHVRPMTSLLFQEPVLPVRAAADDDDYADDAQDRGEKHHERGAYTERHSSQEEHTRSRRRRRSHEHDDEQSRTTQDSAQHNNASDQHGDRTHARDYNDYDEVQEEEHSSRRRGRNRRLNAQERRAAAEVEHIEEDLQYDDIDYTPISEDDDTDTYNGEAEEDSIRVRRRRRRRGGHRSQNHEDNHNGSAEDSDNTDSTDSTDRADDSDAERGGASRHSRNNRNNRDQAGSDSSRDNTEQHEILHRGDDDESTATDTRRRHRHTDEDDETTTVTRRRRRRRKNEDAEEEPIRRSRKQQYIDEITDIEGSTRLEAKKQRRRDNRRDRSRQTTLLEQDFLARREHVNRLMVVREKDQHTQISVIEDSILVEHYVSDIQEVATVGNIYLGRVQNVLPSMEAAFVDIGQARNGVLYAGEVNWDTTRLDGQPRRIELAFRQGDPVLVQVTKDAIGHKGARLTSQVTLAGRFLVLVPSGGMTGVSRKLPERERTRLKSIVANIVPDNMGVIIRTAAEGASKEAIEKDLESLVKQWEKIQKNEEKARNSKRPKLLKGEPDVAIRVVRDIFNDDFNKLVVEGDAVYDRIQEYLETMAPDLQDKLERWDPAEHRGNDVFDQWRIDSQLRKGMERKVFLPSGGSLVIDRTEAMTTIDVNTGRFIGKGKSLEETVTRCNLEAAEEIARQLRLRDIGGMVMIDFVDMVMPANRDLVLRRLVECLARDRTKHQVAEVTSLGLVQMTRKRVGQGLVEAFSEECPTCKGRGFILHDEPTVSAKYDDPYALKGGDPFIATHKYGYSTDTNRTSREDTAMPSGSSQEVKDKLARIAAAAQAASEERKSQEQ